MLEPNCESPGPSTKGLILAKGIRDSQYLYLTTIGRKTGLPREIEIWFVCADDKLYVLAEHFHRAHWVQNIQKNPRVRIQIGEHEFTATARILDADRDQKTWTLAQTLEHEKYGWGEGLPVEISPDETLPP